MAALSDPEILAMFRHALSLWRFTGYVTVKPTAAEWLDRNVSAFTATDLGRLLFEHVESGGEIDQVRETRLAWSEHRFHYDFRVLIGERRLYVETVLRNDDPADPTLHVVSIHDA